MPRKFTADPAALYMTDNGRCVCGEHLGMTAKATGRDISGQKILKVTDEFVELSKKDGWTPDCETCGKAHAAAPAAPWAARCECYNSHNSSSGRCNARNVTDPHAAAGGPVLCKWCRESCVGNGRPR